MALAHACPVGKSGSDCTHDHVPGCRNIRQNDMLTPPWMPTTCTCLQQWARFASPFHDGTNAFAGVDGRGLSCYDVAADAPCFANDTGHGIMTTCKRLPSIWHAPHHR